MIKINIIKTIIKLGLKIDFLGGHTKNKNIIRIKKHKIIFKENKYSYVYTLRKFKKTINKIEKKTKTCLFGNN